MQPEDQQRTGWLRRTLQRLAPRRAQGDVVAANVEQGARNVVVGKNIVQIGTLIVPIPLLGGVFVLLLGGLGLLVWQIRALAEPGAATMTGSFNVAIAPFTEIDARGRPTGDRATGLQLSEWVYQVLDARKRAYAQIDVDAEATLQLWYDGLPRSVKAVPIGPIAGATAEERETAAAARADALGADVIIYGTWSAERGLTPEFYVVPRQRYAIHEIIGRYQLGSEPVRVDMSDRPAMQRRLTPRTTALFWLLVGLRYATNGEAEQAVALLDQAEAELNQWPEDVAGRDTLLFLKGQSALFAADRTADAGRFEELVATAQESFDGAIAANPAFARVYVGRASVALRQASKLPPDQLLAGGLIDEGIRFYAEAQRRAPDTPNAELVASAAELGIAQAHRLRADARLRLAQAAGQPAEAAEHAAAAQAELAIAQDGAERALRGFEALATPEYRFIGQTEYTLAVVARQQGLARGFQGDAMGNADGQRQAIAAAERCIALRSLPEAESDDILQRDVVTQRCVPLRAQAQATLDGLAGEPQ